MLTLQRLNMDTSWRLAWDGAAVVLDPWLVGSEVDGFAWFNEQWHATPPVAIDALPAAEALVVTQSYADHCHPETIDALPADWRILAVDKALGALRRYGDRVERLPEAPEALAVGPLSLSVLRPDRRLDPIYYALVVRRGDEAVVYCPHGFAPTEAHRAALDGLRVRALITTFTDFQLPAWLGGRVNPGLENVRALVRALRPEAVLNCHDEPKRARGLVSRIAKVERADLDRVELEGTRFVPTPDYAPVEL